MVRLLNIYTKVIPTWSFFCVPHDYKSDPLTDLRELGEHALERASFVKIKTLVISSACSVHGPMGAFICPVCSSHFKNKWILNGVNFQLSRRSN